MLNPTEEKKFADLRAQCRELKVSAPPEVFIGLKVYDRNGNLLVDDIQRGHSWNRNLYNFLFTELGKGLVEGFWTSASTRGAGIISLFRMDGINYYDVFGAGGNIKPVRYGGAGDTGNGIIVGTGDTAFSPEDYKLGTLIAHGVTAGTLSYNAENEAVIEYNSGTKTWKATRTRSFYNSSGSSIMVKETGLVGQAYDPCLYERTVLAPAVAVADEATLVVTYEISMDFSAID